MADKITWADKESLVTDPTIAEINKVTDDNMNEIKSVTNTNADELAEKIVYDEDDITENTGLIIEEVPEGSNIPYINSEIDNEYGTATNRGYSQEYLNKHNVIDVVELFSLNYTSTGFYTGSQTLNDDIKNYKYIDIYCKQYGGNARPCIFRTFPISNVIQAFPIYMGLTSATHNDLTVRTAMLDISGTTMTISRNYQLSITSGSVTSAENGISILKIIGYK